MRSHTLSFGQIRALKSAITDANVGHWSEADRKQLVDLYALLDAHDLPIANPARLAAMVFFTREGTHE